MFERLLTVPVVGSVHDVVRVLWSMKKIFWLAASNRRSQPGGRALPPGGTMLRSPVALFE